MHNYPTPISYPLPPAPRTAAAFARLYTNGYHTGGCRTNSVPRLPAFINPDSTNAYMRSADPRGELRIKAGEVARWISRGEY